MKPLSEWGLRKAENRFESIGDPSCINFFCKLIEISVRNLSQTDYLWIRVWRARPCQGPASSVGPTLI